MGRDAGSGNLPNRYHPMDYSNGFRQRGIVHSIVGQVSMSKRPSVYPAFIFCVGRCVHA
jgi:hypothetical protein